MKKITLPKILDCLENETGEILMDSDTIKKLESLLKKWFRSADKKWLILY